MTEKIKILLADDHNVLRQGIAQILEEQADMQVVAQADNGKDAVVLARQKKPDIVLLDINMPGMDGIEATRKIISDSSNTAIIILTMYRRDDYVFETIKAGASGYLLKEVELDELLSAIRAVAEGEAVIDPAIAVRLLEEFREPQETRKPDKSELSSRDLSILQLIGQGLPNQEIADRLFISEKTVRNRLSMIFHQLHLKNRTEAALYAIREGLVDPDESSE